MNQQTESTYRMCNKCEEEKHFSDFTHYNSDGKVYRKKKCKKCISDECKEKRLKQKKDGTLKSKKQDWSYHCKSSYGGGRFV